MSPPRTPGENSFPITRHTPRSLERSAPAKHSVVELRVPAPCPPARSQSRCSRAFASALIFALGGQGQGTPHIGEESSVPGVWRGQEIREPPKKSLPRTPIPLRAPHSPLSLARAAEPGSRVFGGCRMPSGNLGATGRPGSGQSAAEDAGQAKMSACSPASAATLLESRATLPVQGVDEGGGAARSRPARCLCKFPRESAPSRPASDLRCRELGRPRGVFCRSLARDLEPMGAAGLERSSKAS